MNVKALVELHEEYIATSQSLPQNLGDGYLCHHNLLYRNVRRRGLECGTTYSAGGSERWDDYLVFPLVNFEDLLATKQVPYVDNYNVLRRLAEKRPQMTLPEKFIRDGLRRNYLLHETCHCIAHDYLSDLPTDESDAAAARLFDSLLGEALANSVELVASALAGGSAHIFLFVLNSYVPYSPKLKELLEAAIDKTGLADFLKLTFASYFFNNLLGYEHTPENVERILEEFSARFGLELDGRRRPAVFEALLRCSRLNPRFRDETSVVYFTSFGLGDKYAELSVEKCFAAPSTLNLVADRARRLCELVLETRPVFAASAGEVPKTVAVV